MIAYASAYERKSLWTSSNSRKKNTDRKMLISNTGASESETNKGQTLESAKKYIRLKYVAFPYKKVHKSQVS